MSIFDYPRINFQGQIKLNPGTANNADYAQQLYYNGQPLTLIDPSYVEPNTYGMSDPDFIAWIQKKHQFTDASGHPSGSPLFPSEWNYYGPMTMKIVDADKTNIIGVQTNRETSYTAADPNVPISQLVNQPINLSGHLTDVNSEGSPPATQFFVDSLSIGSDINLSGFSKGVGQWLNFYRNINLTQDGGAGAYVYHVIAKDDIGGLAQYFDGEGIAGIICRYYFYRPMLGNATEQMYENQEQNPAPIEIVGTFAPWYEGEDITTVPVGRLLLSNEQNIATPSGVSNNGDAFGAKNGNVALAPAVVRAIGDSVAIDCLSTFPDYYQSGQTPENPKYDFGAVNLKVTNGKSNTLIGNIPYADVLPNNVQKGDANGWVFNFDISTNSKALKILATRDKAHFYLENDHKSVLRETDYYFVSNQSAVYGEQNGSTTEFWNETRAEEIKVAVYHRGRRLAPDKCPDISVWQYKSVPIQSPGNKELIDACLKPGRPISINTDQPGNFLLTFGIGRPPAFPPESYNGFSIPPFITNAPQISLRILPNNVDFSQYYEDSSAPEDELIGNALLTFDIVFQHALRTYWLLYPAMKAAFDLNDCRAVASNAAGILHVTSMDNWMSVSYMPRTRDLSLSRRSLLRAWCRKVQKIGVDAACQGC